MVRVSGCETEAGMPGLLQTVAGGAPAGVGRGSSPRRRRAGKKTPRRTTPPTAAAIRTPRGSRLLSIGTEKFSFVGIERFPLGAWHRPSTLGGRRRPGMKGGRSPTGVPGRRLENFPCRRRAPRPFLSSPAITARPSSGADPSRIAAGSGDLACGKSSRGC